MDEPQKCYAKGNKLDTKDCIFYDSIYMKCPEKANIRRQKADQWLPRAEDGSRDELQTTQGNLLGVKNVLILDCGDGFTTTVDH